jgi:hypothetical protein
MTATRSTMLIMVCMLSACTNEDQKFADACLAELHAKDSGKLTLTAEDLLAGVTKLPDGSVEMTAIAIYGAGTAEERQMPVVCNASLEGGVVNVKRTQFNISTQ